MQHTYIIGQTPLDEDEKRDLIPSIITRKDLDIFEQENIIEARQWLMTHATLTKHDIFSEAFLTTLHKRMYGHVWKWAGQYRKSNKNIGVEYYQIPIELRHLLDDTRYWLTNKTYNFAELAVIFHHRLVKIHLFSNGNGRHARLCADAIVKKHNTPPLTWGSNSDLTKPDEIRKRYIAALREADKGNYEAIIEFSVS
jgi:Fic-DOC domain mobile mystery protein B